MTGAGGILDDDEVEFLLAQHEQEDDDSAAFEIEDPIATNEVTMRGDLDKINLADIFQTLALSKMEGLLRLSTPLETRQLYFRDGYARVLVPPRTETKRLGQRLVRAGYVTIDQLRSALLLQRKSRAQLGELLAEQGLVDAQAIDGLLIDQVQEDLYGLFTWRHGSFDFFKGEIEDPRLAKRLEQCPEFEVNGVLLEVARRSDEWQTIIDAIGDLDEILEVVEASPQDQFTEDELEVVERTDGHRSIREMADASLQSQFEFGRVVRDLVTRGALRHVEVATALAVARDRLDTGEVKRALVTVHAVLERNQRHDLETTIEIAEILQQCGERRTASAFLVTSAGSCAEPTESLELARRARTLQSRSVEVLQYLYDLLVAIEGPESSELATVGVELVDALTEAGEHEEALLLVEGLEQGDTHEHGLSLRRARILHRLGRSDDAVEVLMELVELYRTSKDRERLAAIYEQILKIDHKRRDIARALKALHASKLAQRTRMLGIVAAIAAAGWVGWMQFESWKAEEEAVKFVGRVAEMIERGDLDAASTLLVERSVDYGHIDEFARTQERLARMREKQRETEKATRDETRTKQLGIAVEHVENGRILEALNAYAAVDGMSDKEREKIVNGRLDAVRRHLVDLAKTLPTQIPTEPNLLQTESEQRETLATLRRTFVVGDLVTANSVIAARDHELLASALSTAHRAELLGAAKQVIATFATAERVGAGYRDALATARTAERLTPLYHRAKQHEERYEFEEALAAYRQLHAEHPTEDELKRNFKQRVERYATILRFLGLIEEATVAGDFDVARGHLRSLTETFPNVPFATLASLPVRVESTPPGATVIVDGENRGTTPMVTSYRPAETTTIRLELDGFHTEEATLNGDEIGMVRSRLALVPSWRVELPAPVERPVRVDDRGRIFAVDRAGNVHALQAEDGEHAWQIATGDLSGLLPAPVLLPDGLLGVASVDGTLRALRRATGEQAWAVDGVPVESDPVLAANRVVVATNTGRLVAFAASGGELRFDLELPAGVQGALLTNGRVVFVACVNGAALAVNASNGRVIWSRTVGRGFLTGPIMTVTGGRSVLTLASDDGALHVVDAGTGESIWRRQEFGELTHAPVVAGSVLLAAGHDELIVFDPATGNPIERLSNASPWSTDLGKSGSLVFAGDRDGIVQVLRAPTLTPRFLLRGAGQVTGPVHVDARGAIATFADRTLAFYAELP